MKMHYGFARESGLTGSAVFYRTPEMEQTVDRGPRPRHFAQTRRVARLRINLIISATKSSGGYAMEIHKEARGGGSADRVDTSRDNGDYRGEHSVFPPSLPFRREERFHRFVSFPGSNLSARCRANLQPRYPRTARSYNSTPCRLDLRLHRPLSLR